MIKYNIEIKYILNGIEETRNMYYKSVNVLNNEQQEEVIQDFINNLKKFYGIETILEKHILEHDKDKEKIDFNKLANYKSLAYGASTIAQLGKVKEEYKELLAEVRETSTFTTIKNMDNFKAEGLDLITATINLMLLSGLTEQDFDKHIEKLESYKNGKYKR
jgi:hypothetical protein